MGEVAAEKRQSSGAHLACWPQTVCGRQTLASNSVQCGNERNQLQTAARNGTRRCLACAPLPPFVGLIIQQLDWPNPSIWSPGRQWTRAGSLPPATGRWPGARRPTPAEGASPASPSGRPAGANKVGRRRRRKTHCSGPLECCTAAVPQCWRAELRLGPDGRRAWAAPVASMIMQICARRRQQSAAGNSLRPPDGHSSGPIGRPCFRLSCTGPSLWRAEVQCARRTLTSACEPAWCAHLVHLVLSVHRDCSHAADP